MDFFNFGFFFKHCTKIWLMLITEFFGVPLNSMPEASASPTSFSLRPKALNIIIHLIFQYAQEVGLIIMPICRWWSWAIGYFSPHPLSPRHSGTVPQGLLLSPGNGLSAEVQRCCPVIVPGSPPSLEQRVNVLHLPLLARRDGIGAEACFLQGLAGRAQLSAGVACSLTASTLGSLCSLTLLPTSQPVLLGSLSKQALKTCLRVCFGGTSLRCWCIEMLVK